MMNYWGYNNCWPMMWSMGFGGSILSIIFWILLIFLIVAIARRVGRGGNWWYRGNEKTALDVLKERYARGEISREEYESMKKDLE